MAIALFAVGCYAPSAPADAPCDPAAPHCPSGQQCVGAIGATVCSSTGSLTDAPLLPTADATRIDAAHADALPGSGDAAIDASIALDAAADAPLAPLHLDYPASVAACIDPLAPDPSHCTQLNGSAQLAVDAHDASANEAWQGYVRFEVDGQLVGRTITAVTLVLVATSDSKSASPNSGEVWSVSPFTTASLSISTPMQIAKVGLSQGSVVPLQTVQWPLPITAASANQPVYLGLITPNTDGTNYWNLTGPKPPILHVDAQ